MTIIKPAGEQTEVKTSLAGAPPLPRPSTPAHIIRDDAEAIAVAHALAADFAQGAAARDRDRTAPVRELDLFSQSGLWSINVPRAHGGPELSYVTLSRVIAIVSAADPSIGQIPQNHLGVVAASGPCRTPPSRSFSSISF